MTKFQVNTLIVILIMPMLAHAKCHKIYSSSGELVYSSTELPFEYPRPPDTLGSSVSKLVIGGHLVSGSDPTCPPIDKVTVNGRAKIQATENEDRAFRENRERLRMEGANAVSEREERERQRKIAEKLEEEKRKKDSESAFDFEDRVERLKLECASMLRSIPAWKDRDALKIIDVSRDGFKTIRNKQDSHVVVRYSALVNGKNSYGGYIGEKLAFCYANELETRIVHIQTPD